MPLVQIELTFYNNHFQFRQILESTDLYMRLRNQEEIHLFRCYNKTKSPDYNEIRLMRSFLDETFSITLTEELCFLIITKWDL